MNILSTLFITVFSITQVKNENVLFNSSDCQTKCPIRRQTIRSYPPGTALFVGDECVCGGQETIYEYVPPVQSAGNVEIPVGFKPKTIELKSNNRGMGNYGSLVFSANVQILNLLSINNDDIIYKGCCDRKPSKPLNPSSDSLINNNSSEEVTSQMTILGFSDASSTKNETNTTNLDIIENFTDSNVSIVTEPILQNTNPTVDEFITENIVTDEFDLSDGFNSSETPSSSKADKAHTRMANLEQKKDLIVTTTEGSKTLEQSKTPNVSKNKKRHHLRDQVGMATNNSYLDKNPDLQIYIVNTNTFSFNN